MVVKEKIREGGRRGTEKEENETEMKEGKRQKEKDDREKEGDRGEGGTEETSVRRQRDIIRKSLWGFLKPRPDSLTHLTREFNWIPNFALLM